MRYSTDVHTVLSQQVARKQRRRQYIRSTSAVPLQHFRTTSAWRAEWTDTLDTGHSGHSGLMDLRRICAAFPQFGRPGQVPAKYQEPLGGRTTFLRGRYSCGVALLVGCGPEVTPRTPTSCLGLAPVQVPLQQDETILWGFERCPPWSKPIELLSQSRLLIVVARGTLATDNED